MNKYIVKYTVEFKTVIEVPDDSTPNEVACDIDIPEGPEGKYVTDSFYILSIKPFNDQVDWEHDEDDDEDDE